MMTEEERAAHEDALFRVKVQVRETRNAVIKAALLVASEQYAEKADDPGWQGELYDNMLDKACKDYASTLNFQEQVIAEGKRRNNG